MGFHEIRGTGGMWDVSCPSVRFSPRRGCRIKDGGPRIHMLELRVKIGM